MAEGAIIEILGVEETLERFNSLMATNPNMGKQLKAIIRTILLKTARETRKSAKSELSSDPRKAYMAVKSSVYKRIFGGNVSILNKRHRSGYAASLPEKTVRTGRGGNRLKRSARTEQLMSYWGADRGFILRFINAGTNTRQSRYGNRGQISARHWFGPASQSAMQKESQELTQLIDAEIEKVWQSGKVNQE